MPIQIEPAVPPGGGAQAPWRQHYLEVLQRRMAQQALPVQRLLQARHAVVQASVAPAKSPSNARVYRSPLAELNQALAARARPLPNAPAADASAASARPAELDSVRRFRETWSKVSAERQVMEALARAPHNAGPLNSQRLMLRALTLMRQVSPDYLRHFLSQIETLVWLEQANGLLPRPKAAPKKSISPAAPSKPKPRRKSSAA